MAFTLATSAASPRARLRVRARARPRAVAPRPPRALRIPSIRLRVDPPRALDPPWRRRACAAGVDLRKLIERLCDGENLTEKEAEESMDALLDADPAQISAFLVLLRAKGETGEEMAGLARAP